MLDDRLDNDPQLRPQGGQLLGRDRRRRHADGFANFRLGAKSNSRQAVNGYGDNWHVTFRGGIPLVMTNADHWKLKVLEGLLLEAGQPGALTLFNPQRIDGRRNQTGHLNFAKHLLSETWETRHKPGFGGARTGWWKSPKPNHYFDATYQAICARSMRQISVLPAVPAPERPVETHVAEAYYEPTAESLVRHQQIPFVSCSTCYS